MMAFIEQEANEKAEEIDAKVCMYITETLIRVRNQLLSRTSLYRLVTFDVC